MHLAFIDIACAYDAARPDSEEPLGGTNSAVCFLARELAQAGIACTLFNKIEEPRAAHGVQALPLQALIDERENQAYSAFVFCGRWVEWLVEMVAEKAKAPLVAWMHESAFGPKLTPPMDAFHGVAFVSEWQRRINAAALRPHWRHEVIRNAMNPVFAGLYAPGEPVRAAKAQPPVLLYAGATPRGAFHVPAVLDHLRPLCPDFAAEIYCDCAPSRDPQANEAYIAWMRGLPNVVHVGMVGQKELARRMKRASVLIAPNTWPETSCIALIEAMAAGLSVVSTNRAALPETAAGFARHVAVDDVDDPARFDMPVPYPAFADAVMEGLAEWRQDPAEVERKRRAQIDWFLARYQWAQRVAPWVRFVEETRAGMCA